MSKTAFRCDVVDGKIMLTGPPVPSELQTLLHDMGLLKTGQVITGISGYPDRIEFTLKDLSVSSA